MSELLPSLLLLPPPPSPITSASLSAAYQSPITATVSILKRQPTHTQLLVVLPCPNLHGQLQGPRSHIYPTLQQLLGGVYSLLCLVCAKLEVDVSSSAPGSVDARIILLNYDSRLPVLSQQETPMEQLVAGPVVDLPTFSLTRRRWNLIFSVNGEQGQKLLASYMKLANQRSPPVLGHVQSVDGGVSMVQIPKDPRHAEPAHTSSTLHTVVAVGGTFDHLHAGHKLLLTATALLLQPSNLASSTQKRLIVGITGDELLKNKKYSKYLQSWKQRQDDVVEFLLSILSFTRSQKQENTQLSFDEPGPNGRAIHTKLASSPITLECVEISDPFGPTITDEDVTALVVSAETRAGGKAVNDKRVEKGWRALEVFEVDVLDAEENETDHGKEDNFASKISSTAIRKAMAENDHHPSE